MRNWPVILLLFISVLVSCTTERVFLLSDPVFLKMFEAADKGDLNNLLRRHRLDLELININFGGLEENRKWEDILSGADYIFTAPGLAKMEKEIVEAAGSVPVYPLEIDNSISDSYSRTISVIEREDFLQGEETVVILHTKYRNRFNEELSVMGWNIPNVYYWGDGDSESDFSLWVDSLGTVSSVIFLSDSVPLNIFEEILRKKRISRVVHDLPVAPFISAIAGKSIKTRLYTGADFADLLKRELEKILPVVNAN